MSVAKRSKLHKPRPLKPLLVYVGGKSRGLKHMLPHFPHGITEMVSPFIGGGSVEIAQAAKGVRVHAYDLDDALVNFWRYALRDPIRVREACKVYHPIEDHKVYRELRSRMLCERNGLERAALFYAINRASWGGSMYSGGISRENPRFTRRIMHDFDDFRLPSLSVGRADFEHSLLSHANMFAYVDPPYVDTPDYYGPITHGFDHERLAATLRKRGGWIMSNKYCDELFRLYPDNKIIRLEWYYSLSRDRDQANCREALVFSRDLSCSAEMIRRTSGNIAACCPPTTL